MASKVSTPIIEMAAVDGPLPVNRFKVVKIDQRLPGEDPIPVTYKRGRWTVTDFYDGPSCTPCNSSPTTPTPLATFTGPRVGNPPGGLVDGAQVTSPPVILGQGNPLANPGVTAELNPQTEELKLSSENSSLLANRVTEQPDVVTCVVPNPPGLLSPDDRKTSLPNIPGALVLQSPAGRLGRKTSLHDSHKIGFIVEPVLDPSDPIAPVPGGQVVPSNPIVAAIAASEHSSSSSSSSTDASPSSATVSPSTSDATSMATIVQAHPPAGNHATAVKPSNNTAVVNASAVPASPIVNVVPKLAGATSVPVANAVASASVNVTQKPPVVATASDVSKTFSVTTVSEIIDGSSNVAASDQVNPQNVNTMITQPQKEVQMEVCVSPETIVTTTEASALTAAVEAVTATPGCINSMFTSDVSKVNVGGQTDHVTFVDESLVGTASNSIASTAPQSVSIPLVSSVAIDNKIEQAMDLVKSHLMFAVREEVDVLKEKIVELLERIQLLETENAILKQAHQNQLGNQGTQSLVTGIQLNTSPVPATLEQMEVSSVGTSTDATRGDQGVVNMPSVEQK